MLVSFPNVPNQVLTTFFDADDLKRLACTSTENKEKVYRALRDLFTKFVPQNAQLSGGQVSEYFGKKLISYGEAVAKLDSFKKNLASKQPQELLILFLPQERIFEAKVSIKASFNDFVGAFNALRDNPDETLEGMVDDIFSRLEEKSRRSTEKFDSTNPNHFVVFEKGKFSSVHNTSSQSVNEVSVNFINSEAFSENAQQIQHSFKEVTRPSFFERYHFSVSYKGLLATVMVVAAIALGRSYLSQ